MIADPAEETFPFTGHTEFLDVDSSRAAAGRAGGEFSPRLYRPSRRASRGDTASRASTRLEFLLHRTDRPASEALLALRMRLETDNRGDGALMFGLPLVFAFPLVLAALAGLPVLYYLLRVTPPQPEARAVPAAASYSRSAATG